MAWKGLAFVGLAAVLAVATPARADEPERETVGHMGVRLHDVSKDEVSRLSLKSERGAVVSGVDEKSPAAKAGLREGDVIVAYEGEPVQSSRALARMIHETPAGRAVSLEVSRSGQVQKMAVTLDAAGGPGEFFFHRQVMPGMFPMPSMGQMPPMPPHALQFDDNNDRFFFSDHAPRKLGIEYQELNAQMARFLHAPDDHTVIVWGVSEDGPAAKAGMKAGDIVLRIDGKPVRNGADLHEVLHGLDAGKEATVTVQRDGKPLDLRVSLGGRPTPPPQSL